MELKEIIWTLMGVIGLMAGYIMKVHSAERKDRKEEHKEHLEQTKNLTAAIVSQKTSNDDVGKIIEANSKVIQELPDKIFNRIENLR